MPELPAPGDANVTKIAEVINDLLEKLDADGGITDTDYSSTLEIDDGEGNAI